MKAQSIDQQYSSQEEVYKDMERYCEKQKAEQMFSLSYPKANKIKDGIVYSLETKYTGQIMWLNCEWMPIAKLGEEFAIDSGRGTGLYKIEGNNICYYTKFLNVERVCDVLR